MFRPARGARIETACGLNEPGNKAEPTFACNPGKNTADGDVTEHAASGDDEAEESFDADPPGSGGTPRSNSKARHCPAK